VRTPSPVLLSELLGTAVLVAVGVSFVILDFGRGSPVPLWIPDPTARRAITGLLFGATGGALALSPVGRISGAHINPVVTVAFWLRGTLRARYVPGYVLAQLAGGLLGAAPLLWWGRLGASVAYGATIPGEATPTILALTGELITTACLVLTLLLFTGHRALRRFTPFTMAPLYAVMVALEAPWSGTSTNPARSLGPALLAHAWAQSWIYLAGPLLGAALAVALLRLRALRIFESEVAKLYHFERDRHGVFGAVRATAHRAAVERDPRRG
jgi:aquaporin Z